MDNYGAPTFKFEEEVKRLNEQVKVCNKVSDTVATEGWTDIVEPLIDKMISDITGGKLKGRWYGGLLDRARKDERREFYIGYKQALIDFHKRIMAYVDAIKVYEQKRDEMLKAKDNPYTRPMVDDTRYGERKDF